MITIAIVAVFLGMLREAAGLAVLLAIVATPALVRTWVASSLGLDHRQRAGIHPGRLCDLPIRALAVADQGKQLVNTDNGVR